MPARNAIVLRTDQAADDRRDTEGGEVVARDEQAAASELRPSYATFAPKFACAASRRPSSSSARDPGTTGN